MKFLLSTFVFLSAISSYAADAGTRGGGNALICFNNSNIPAAIRKDKGEIKDDYISSIKSIQMLDLYELQTQRGMENPTGGVSVLPVKKGEKMTEFAERMLYRIKPFLPRFYKTAVKIMTEMPPERAFAHEYGIQPVNDYELMGRIDSNNCVVGTVLFHKPQGALTEVHYDQRLWNHKAFNSYNRYVAYLHEVVYRTQREFFPDLESSDSARSFVGQLVSEELSHEYLMQTQDHLRGSESAEDILKNPSACGSYNMDSCMLAFGSDLASFVNLVEAPVFQKSRGLDPKESLKWHPDSRNSFESKYLENHPVVKNFENLENKYGYAGALKRMSAAQIKQLNEVSGWANIEKEYKKYLVDFRSKMFAIYRQQLQKILPEIKASSYMSDEDKTLFISVMNKKLNPTPEENMAQAEEYSRYESVSWGDPETQFLRANINWSKLVPFHGTL